MRARPAAPGLLAVLLALVIAVAWAVSPELARSLQCEDPKMKDVPLVTETFNGGNVLDVYWTGTDAGDDSIILALTTGTDAEAGGRLFRSPAHGDAGSWVDVTEKMEGCVSTGDLHVDPMLAGVLEVHIHHEHPETVAVRGVGPFYWISHDHGGTWATFKLPDGCIGLGSAFAMHPYDADKVLIGMPRPGCLDANTFSEPWCTHDLLYHDSFGENGQWVNITAASGGAFHGFVDWGWAAAARRQKGEAEGDVQRGDLAVFATVYEDEDADKGLSPAWADDVHFVRIDDPANPAGTNVHLLDCGNQFEVLGGQVYVAMPSTCKGPESYHKPRPRSDASTLTLWVSPDMGADEWHLVCVPSRDLDLAYTVVTPEGLDGLPAGALLVVDHDEEDDFVARAPIGNVYASQEKGAVFAVSLPRVLWGSLPDIAAVHGIPGFFLANAVDPRAMSVIDPHTGLVDVKDFVQSRVTFNSGGMWSMVKTPDTFQYPVCNRCPANADPRLCSLHLHHTSSAGVDGTYRPPVYAHHSAPGVVMASGNVGPQLSFDADAMCTFLSTDGGQTWTDVAVGPMIYEYGDHGGVLVMARHYSLGPADRVHVSFNYGECWYDIKLDAAMDVHNIRVDPMGSTTMFLVHGTDCVQDQQFYPQAKTCDRDQAAPPRGKVAALDVRKWVNNGDGMAECGDDDYQDWQSHTPNGCVLGRQFHVQVRKKDAMCFNGREYDRTKAAGDACACDDAADLQCEPTHTPVLHQDGTRTCEPLRLRRGWCPLLDNKDYYASATGKRLVAGDQCDNLAAIVSDTDGKGHKAGADSDDSDDSDNDDDDDDNKKKKRRGRRKRHVVRDVFVFVMVLGIVGVTCGVFWKKVANDGMRERALASLSLAMDVAVGVWDWIRAKLGRRRAAEDYFTPLDDGGMQPQDYRQAVPL